MRLLLTWSDRAVGETAPSHHRPRSPRDRGPVLRLLDQPESHARYDAARVFATAANAGSTAALVEAMRERIPEVRLEVLPVDDPSDHEQLFRAMAEVARAIPAGTDVTTLLSAGTPQAQTIWVILVKAGLLPARMLQVIPPAFVPDPHPRAIREIELDFDGFPEIRALREEVGQLRARERARYGLVGDSPPMQVLGERIARVATARLPVLVLGETGTGKEVVARAIHEAGGRAKGPFLAESCAALAEGTLASELFGHERGAFTGAMGQKRGLFELAHGGTLFLDEIGEISPRVQVNLLRVLEEGTLRRVGGEVSVRVDVRIVAATHRDLAAMTREGTFREDLYYRLRGAVLEVPPLRERTGDLEALIAHFLEAHGGAGKRPTRDAMRALRGYRWPGNVRELRAEVARWVVFAGARVELEDLSAEIREQAPTPIVEPSAPMTRGGERRLAEVVAEAEAEAIAAAMARHDGNLSRTARALGIDRNTLKRKLRRASVPGDSSS